MTTAIFPPAPPRASEPSRADAAHAYAARASATPAAPPVWQFKVLIDNACPLCRHEGRLMTRLDKGRGHLALEDIADPAFDPARYGRTMDELMGSIHGVLPDGSLVTGVEVFRRAYAAVGVGWVLAWTRWPIARPLADAAYRLFARIRLKLPGRTPCDAGTCRVP